MRVSTLAGNHYLLLQQRVPAMATTSRCVYRRHYTSSSVLSSSTTIGFIGLGNMGYPMARNLQTAAETLVVFDNNPEVLKKARANNMITATSLYELTTQNCDIVFTMLPGCAAVDATMTELFQHEYKKGAAATKVLVDCSTVSPATSQKWHMTWKEKCGSTLLDAPVSGGVKGATEGTLTFMVGGCENENDAAWKKAQPLLQRMGSRSLMCGQQSGSGAAVKLCNNLALACQMVGICEAMNLGTACGVDPFVLANVMNTSTAGCWSSRVNNPHPDAAAALAQSSPPSSSPAHLPPAANHYEGGFGTKLMLKDLGLAVDAAQKANVAVPLTDLSRQLYTLANNHGLGSKDFGVMLAFLQGRTSNFVKKSSNSSFKVANDDKES